MSYDHLHNNTECAPFLIFKYHDCKYFLFLIIDYVKVSIFLKCVKAKALTLNSNRKSNHIPGSIPSVLGESAGAKMVTYRITTLLIKKKISTLISVPFMLYMLMKNSNLHYYSLFTTL